MASRGESSTGAGTGSRFQGAPSRPPGLVIPNAEHQQERQSDENPLSTVQDLWISSADGRYSSPPIPVRVGRLHNAQTFYVHKHILVKSKWFLKALCGKFREAKDQAVTLPEEDPALFHFVVAFLYEGQFNPILPASTALEPQLDKGKGRDVDHDASDPNATSPTGSTTPEDAALNIRKKQLLRHQSMRETGKGLAQKRLGLHRTTCYCSQCLNMHNSQRCWQCGVLGTPTSEYQARQIYVHTQRYLAGYAGGSQTLPSGEPAPNIKDEDMRTWLMAYELHIDVYICANRYLMDDFSQVIMRATIDLLEAAGTDAGHPTVLQLCRRLHAGVPETDPLLKMILARVGFLQPFLWKRAPDETQDFLVHNPEIVTLMLKETVSRHTSFTTGSVDLPPMDSSVIPGTSGSAYSGSYMMGG